MYVIKFNLKCERPLTEGLRETFVRRAWGELCSTSWRNDDDAAASKATIEIWKALLSNRVHQHKLLRAFCLNLVSGFVAMGVV